MCVSCRMTAWNGHSFCNRLPVKNSYLRLHIALGLIPDDTKGLAMSVETPLRVGELTRLLHQYDSTGCRISNELTAGAISQWYSITLHPHADSLGWFFNNSSFVFKLNVFFNVPNQPISLKLNQHKAHKTPTIEKYYNYPFKQLHRIAILHGIAIYCLYSIRQWFVSGSTPSNVLMWIINRRVNYACSGQFLWVKWWKGMINILEPVIILYWQHWYVLQVLTFLIQFSFYRKCEMWNSCVFFLATSNNILALETWKHHMQLGKSWLSGTVSTENGEIK